MAGKFAAMYFYDVAFFVYRVMSVTGISVDL